MIYIYQSEWREIPSDYKSKSIYDPNVRTVFAGCIISGGGTTLLFEHKHFEIIKDEEKK